MTDAPKRIWLGLDLEDPNAGFHDFRTVDWGSVKTHETDAEYILATEAERDAALERAAEIAAKKIFAGGEDRSETASSVYRAIRALIDKEREG